MNESKTNADAKTYYLGLDMGTNSVGWAVTDKEYHILRAKGKDLWGVREFDEAQTSAERRSFRTARRRHQREVARRGYLRDIFHDAITETDPYFFQRLDNSWFQMEDKDPEVRTKSVLFNDPEFQDRDYFKKYPTVYHLRMDLIDHPEPHDVRLVYLALANMFKHRGHFLNAGLDSVSTDGRDQGFGAEEMQDACERLRVLLAEEYDLALPAPDSEMMVEVLGNKSISRTAKSEKLEQNLNPGKDKRISELIKGISGRTFLAEKLFADFEPEEKVKICFAEGGFEDRQSELVSVLGEERYALIDLMHEIYIAGSLAGIMGHYRYLSEARVADYEKHREDLKRLKKVIRRYGTKEEYDMMFRGTEKKPGEKRIEKGSYSAYVNSTNSGEKLRRNADGRNRDDFYKNVKGLLSKFDQDDPDVKTILSDIAAETFMPRMLTGANGVIPNQIHASEMRAILTNAQNYLPFLKEKDESGLTASERILRLFSFRIPYYVGPTINRDGSGWGWAVRREEGPVLPWNLEQKIDIKKTKEQFIERLIRNCTYLSGEKVLPKSSLLYERYMVLNEINNIRIRDERPDVPVKQQMFHELFESGKHVTRKKIASWFMNRGLIDAEQELTGIDTGIGSSLASYSLFRSIFGKRIEEDSVRRECEDIIRICTIYGDDRAELKKTLKSQYGEILGDQELKRISGYRFADWGRLSKEFLELPGADKETGEVTTLIRALWETNYNLMELLHSERFTFGENLEKKTRSVHRLLSDLKPEDLEEYYFSAPVRRMIWQTVLVIREISYVMGSAPSRIFVEMTRSDEKKGEHGRKDSRKENLLKSYRSMKENSDEWIGLINKADENGQLRSKKMFLYLTQMGRDLYTGKPIDLDRLYDDNLYDIDHIYPRHFVKDDSILNNLVLVNKPENARKKDQYPLDIRIRNNPEVRNLWEALRTHHLITEEKYHRLTGSTSFTEEELAGFIARQVVETGQAAKAVTDLLREMLPDTEVVYSKAGNVSEFRHTYNFPKSRIVNDFHHANDAYLNIVVGNVYYTKFTKNPLHFIRGEYEKDQQKYRYNMDKMFERDVIRNGDVAWKASKDHSGGTITVVREMMAKQTPLLSRMPHEVHGGIADQTLYGKNTAKEGIYLSLKGSDPRMSVEKYGGYNKASGAWFFLVEHEIKGKKVRTIESVPVYLAKKIEENPKELERYCTGQLGLVNPSVRIRKILVQSLIKRNGYEFYLTGRTGKQLTLGNAVSLKLDSSAVQYSHLLEKYTQTSRLDNRITEEGNLRFYDLLSEKQHANIYRERPASPAKILENGRDSFIGLSMEEQCRTLLQILNLTKIGKAQGDLKSIGGSANTGVMLMNKKINDCREIKLIHQSVTGLYEKEVDLLTV